VQTNLQQVDVNKFTFQLDDAENINHIVVFLLGTIPFQPGYAATVHLLWPNKTWHLLGMLSNEKASAIFRLKAANTSRSPSPFANTSANEMSMDTPNPLSATPITATLGISIEPIDNVMSQIASLQSSSTTSTSNPSIVPSSNALVTLSANIKPESVAEVAQRVMTHLYNHVTSFATSVLPPGSNVLVPAGGPGSAANVLASGIDSSFLPVKAFNDWYQNVTRKAKTDPMFLARD
ncbi:hypothetical protein BGX27_002458, partial [Mortierella sp. AM989]